jgi:hypothetical protein
MSSAYKIGGMIRTEPRCKRITDWCIQYVDDTCVMAWGVRDDGDGWYLEPIEFAEILAYCDPPE